ncbi:MAG TPA: DegV family protein [Candidatus Dormibacteraeota bacterium]|nr:DegV family protein [Candidatus Dormibacteraeota bacterium]
MAGVAIVTDSAADLTPEVAAGAGIRVVPLEVSFGSESFRAGIDLSTEAFWARMLAPSAPFPTTAAASPGDFGTAYQAAFASGATAVVCITVSGKLSGTVKSATIARDLMTDRDVRVVDSRTASMGHGLLALFAAELARRGLSADEIVTRVEERIPDTDLYVALDTLEYLRRGGRLSPAQAAIGSLLSVKPIITVRDGRVDTAERVRTRTKARERVLELLTERPAERIAILYTPGADPDAFREDVLARTAGSVEPDAVSVQLVGPSVGPHLGPGCLGGVVLLRR